MDIFTPVRLIYSKLQFLRNYFLLMEEKNEGVTIFIDVTEVHQNNTKTGVQRVTTSVLNYLYKETPEKYKIVEVYAKPHGAGFFCCKDNKPMKICPTDIFFGLDLSKFILPQNFQYLKKMYHNGVAVYFFVHDIMPITIPEYCSVSVRKIFPKWLKTVIQFTGLIANSKSTMDEVQHWLAENPSIPRNKNLKLNYVHLGADFVENKKIVPAEMKPNIPTILMVSTVEPRKKYDQALAAFEILWKKNIKVHLQIVGRRGWNNEATIKKLDSSPFLNKTLFWYDSGISDEELADLYQNCSAVLFTSIAEGFGLAVVEAGYYKKPVILRDIPVFREIAGDNAFYFDSLEPEKLAETIEQWLDSYRSGTVSVPDIHLTSWKQCTQEILQIILRD